uniref:ATP synthase F0 subunit 8 n=1 Tax=Vietnamella sinensis TaxID=2758365 RepID=UPI002176E7AE|nr:ATP synthase F0 subunit 8 [Vietnamella sinensis]UUL99597.1 ATP synthase F0 subunit 8 [Vietnamella sinensis]UUL99623.1 ATP synthase F0 subunit 8 [Vietnamella sinensis]
MAPLSWLILFSFFTFIFILFNVINYYISIPSNFKKSDELTIITFSSLSWPW